MRGARGLVGLPGELGFQLSGAYVCLRGGGSRSPNGSSDQYAKFAQKHFVGCEKGEPGPGLFEKLFFLTDDTRTGNE
jgi:hypothetical protein